MRPHHGKDRYESARQHHAAAGTTSRWVIIWLAIVVVFSLGTMDLIGLALYSITLVIYLARNKAIAAQQDVIRTWARTHQG